MTSPKERLLALLSGGTVDRPPFIASALHFTGPPADVVEKAGLDPDALSSDPAALAALSFGVQRETALECLSLPYTMTVESEAYGGETEAWPSGLVASPPTYPLSGTRSLEAVGVLDPAASGRLPVVVETIGLLSKKAGELPVIGDLVAPLSLATSLMDGRDLYRSLIDDPEGVDRLLGLLVENSVRFCRAQVEAGAHLIAVTDPAATSASLGAALFSRFSLPYLNRLADEAHRMGVPVIVHLCGDLDGLAVPLKALGAQCLSVDSSASIGALREAVAQRIMGNLDPLLLAEGREADVAGSVRAAITAGVHIIAPGCGLGAPVSGRTLRGVAAALA